MAAEKLNVPDLGTDDSVEVIEVLVKPGDTLKLNDSVVVLRVTDRMSASSSRIIDVSWAAAKKLNFVRDGLAQVELKLIDTLPHK